jgi:hypothetical protein
VERKKMTPKILKSHEDVPSQVTSHGHIYKKGPAYGNLEEARREARYLREHGGFLVTVRKFYIQPSRPYSYYVLYVRKG